MNPCNPTRYKTLVLFSDRFPCGAISEHTFITPDIEAAAQYFDKVIIVPSARSTDMKDCSITLPQNVEIDCSWLESNYGRNRWLRAIKLIRPSTWRRVHGDINRGGLTMSMFAGAAADHLYKWIKKRGLNRSTTLFYTFWFDLMAAALAVLSQKEKLHWISRAHGFDIYTDRGGQLREAMLQQVETLYVASESGKEYLQQRYPKYKHKIHTKLLGSDNTYGTPTQHHKSDEKTLTFLSVASIIELKRVHLNAKLLIALAKGRPSTKIKWIHIGDGDREKALSNWLSSQQLPGNFEYELRGAMSNSAVHNVYRHELIDWTMLLSRQEGGNPIAAAESLSYGVPMIATDAGGLGEIITDDCGILLPLDVQEEEFVRGILPYLDSEARYQQLCVGARHRWEEDYNAAKLRADFFKELNAP